MPHVSILYHVFYSVVMVQITSKSTNQNILINEHIVLVILKVKLLELDVLRHLNVPQETLIISSVEL